MLGARGQELFAEEDGDDDAADHERDARQREFEVAEAATVGVVERVGDQHVHRRAGQQQHRAAVRPEDERHEKTPGRAAEPHGEHDDHGQERGHRAVHADERAQDGDGSVMKTMSASGCRPTCP